MGHRPQLVVAAKVLVYVNGRLFGQCTSFSWTSTTGDREVTTVDVDHAMELAPTVTRVSWSMGVLRSIGDGGMQGAGVVPQQQVAASGKYFSLLLLERTSNLVLFKADLSRTSQENWSVNAKGKMEGQVSGKSILWNNESAQ